MSLFEIKDGCQMGYESIRTKGVELNVREVEPKSLTLDNVVDVYCVFQVNKRGVKTPGDLHIGRNFISAANSKLSGYYL